jgi:hypothetical protein
MVRLLLITAPAIALISGISVSTLVKKLAKSIKQPEKSNIPRIASVGFLIVNLLSSCFYGT